MVAPQPDYVGAITRWHASLLKGDRVPGDPRQILRCELKRVIKRQEKLADCRISERFFDTLGQNDDETIKVTESLFFVLSRLSDGEAYRCVLSSGLLAPRPMAIFLARVWHTGRPEVLDVANPQRMIVPFFRHARDHAAEVLMDTRSLALFRSLPETTIVYRGSRDRRADRNPSWSLDPLFAAKFVVTCGRGSDAAHLLKAEVAHPHILAAFDLCGEKELVIDPAGLLNVRIVK